MGTLRMGADAKTSVVDAELRSHDHANLFVTGMMLVALLQPVGIA
jgi:choline dehydrogenase-like flavoprotein